MVVILKSNFRLIDAVAILGVFLSYGKYRQVPQSKMRIMHWREDKSDGEGPSRTAFALKSLPVPLVVPLGLAGVLSIFSWRPKGKRG